MCGFAALVSLTGAPIDVDQLGRMTRALAHRGPDDEGYLLASHATGRPSRRGAPTRSGGTNLPWLGELRGGPWTAGLGVRRLAIREPGPAGRQPMASPDGRLWVALNGELYGDGAPARVSRRAGWRFTGACDTETMLAAWRAWGAARPRASTGCSLRRVGRVAPPLHLRARPLRHQAALLRRPWRPRPDRLRDQGDPRRARSTMPGSGMADRPRLRGVAHHRPHAVHVLRRHPSGTAGRSCWSSLRAGTRARMGRRSTRRTTRRRRAPHRPARPFTARSTRPSTITSKATRWSARTLSGGLDSTSILMAASRRGGRREAASMDVFTAVFDQPSVDERRYARAAADAAGARHHLVPDRSPRAHRRRRRWRCGIRTSRWPRRACSPNGR